MKRLHVHVAVHDLEQSIRFYSALFAAQPAVKKDDYAKWMLDDPRVNFAISTRGKKAGLDHLGIQAEDSAELEEIGSRLAQADVSVLPQKDAACCYAKSDKYWTIDPQGIAWESFHTLDSIPMYGGDTGTVRKMEKSACCAPAIGRKMEKADIKTIVKERYARAALNVTAGAKAACCGGPRDRGQSFDPVTSNLYEATQTGTLPESAVLASLGCGNPTALAALKPGEVVLDLGSGGGIDVLLSAKRVGPTGKAYGLDMTDEMLALAQENKRKAGAQNVEFLKGDIENIPLPDNSVDVIISNCVINLAADKDRVLREAFRVLKPGGRFAVSDVVTKGAVPPAIRESMLLWVGCVAGALEEDEYRAKLAAAGFQDVDIEPTRIYRAEDARSILEDKGIDVAALAGQVDGKFSSAFIRATKPGKT